MHGGCLLSPQPSHFFLSILIVMINRSFAGSRDRRLLKNSNLICGSNALPPEAFFTREEITFLTTC